MDGNQGRDFCRYCRFVKCLKAGMRTEEVQSLARKSIKSETALSFFFSNEEESLLSSRFDQLVIQRCSPKNGRKMQMHLD